MMPQRWWIRRQSCLWNPLRLVAPLSFFVLSLGLHSGTLQGEFVWDDRMAVLQNPDLWKESPWGDMWRHDFWGQDITDPESHKSFRPLTTLTYRLNSLVVEWLAVPPESWGSSGEESMGEDELEAFIASHESNEVFSFHLVNIVLHAATSAMSMVLFRGIFEEELPAIVSSLVFVVHPVHVDAVAPIVGRADLLCGFFSVAALILVRRRQGTSHRGMTHSRRRGPQDAVFMSQEVDGNKGASGREGVAGKGPSNEPADGAKKHVVKEALGDPGHAEGKTEATIRGPAKVLESTLDAAKPRNGTGAARFGAVLILAAAATLCKEVGVTVFLLAGGVELVDFLEKTGLGLSRARAAARGIKAPGLGEALRDYWSRAGPAPVARFVASVACAVLAVGGHVALHGAQVVRRWGLLENDISVLPRLLSYSFTHAFYAYKFLWPEILCHDWGFRCIPHVTSLTDPANIAALALYGAVAWGSATAVSRGDTALMWGLALLVVPFFPASNALLTIGVVVAERLIYLPSLGACVLVGCVVRGTDHGSRRDCAIGFEAAVKSPVPTEVRSGDPKGGTLQVHIAPIEDSSCSTEKESQDVMSPPNAARTAVLSSPRKTSPPAGSEAGSPCSTSFGISNPSSSTPASAVSPQGTSAASMTCLTKPLDGEGAPRKRKGQTGTSSQVTLDQSGTSEAPIAGSTGASEIRNSSERETTRGEVKEDPWIRPGYDADQVAISPRKVKKSVPRVKVPVAAVLVVVGFWCSHFGIRTMKRCNEWVSERSLFESALNVCPDGVKILNNLASRMLNTEEAERAQGLLKRALRTHSRYPTGLVNLGVALVLRGERCQSIKVMEESLRIGNWNLGTSMWLAEAYFDLAQELKGVLERVSMKVPRAELTVDREEINKLGDIRRLQRTAEDESRCLSMDSPERLLDMAESYVDSVLASTWQPTLARFVKGDILVLRGQYQEAARHFQTGIDIKLGILEETMEGALDLQDVSELVSGYNRLGLALKEDGTDFASAKEAFETGLKLDPKDVTLMINGGTVYQAAGDLVGAKELYDRAFKLNSSFPELLSNIGWLEEEIGGKSEESLKTAEDLYSRALEGLAPSSPARRQVETNLINARARLKQLDEPHAEYESLH